MKKLLEFRKTVSKNIFIFHEGDPSGETYILMEGEIEIIKNDEIIAVIKENGTFFGEMSSLLEIPRTASVRTRTDCELIVIKPADFETIIQLQPGVGYKLARILAERLLVTTTKLMSVLSLIGESSDISLEALDNQVILGEEQKDDLLKTLNEDSSQIYINTGNDFYNKKDFKEAIRNYTRALCVDPSNSDVLAKLANSYYYMKDFQNAAEKIQNAIDIEPENPNYRNNLALYLYKLEDLDGAEREWTQVLRIDPENKKAKNNLYNLKQLKRNKAKNQNQE